MQDRSLVETLADQLEEQHGAYPPGRSALLAWVDDQLERCARVRSPGAAALEMIANAYLAALIELEVGGR